MEISRKAEELARMKRFCLWMLFFCVAMSVALEILFHQTQSIFLVFLKGAFGAAVVGAMADWYAVVALFRHPLGLSRLPHTAIIPRKKDDIGDNLGKFVRDEFMQDEVVLQKLQSFRPVDKFFEWMAAREKKYFISRFLGRVVIAVLNDKSAAYLNEFARSNIAKLVESTDASSVLSRIIHVFDNEKFRNDCINLVLDKLIPYLQSEKDDWVAQAKVTGVWGTKWIGGKYVDGFIDAMFRKLLEIRADAWHPARDEVKEMLERWIKGLQSDPQTMAAVNQFKRELIESEQFNAFINDSVARVKASIIDDLQRRDSRLVEHVHQGLLALVERYKTDSEFNEYLHRLVEKLAVWLLSHKNKIAEHLSEQVRAWSPDMVSQKLELEIGKDLQWIRVSGTIVGGLVGGIFSVVLFLIH
jgi:uncharacterized membrane-anchored protein YjiN (DUF445 family)